MASAAEDNVGVRRKITELRVVDLRIELEKRGLDKTGIKAVLVDKLQKALLEEGADVNEIVIDGSSAKGGARKSTPRRVTEKPDDEHDEPLEELDTDELMDGEFLQVDSTGDQSLDGLSQDEELTLDGITVDDQVTDEEVLRKAKPDVLLDTIDDDNDINDDAINISAEDDQLLTEDEAIGDPSEDAGASSIVGGPGTTDEDQFETTPATDSSTPAPDVEGERDDKKVMIDSVTPEKQEVDNESLIVHVDEPSLLELDADLTKPEEKIIPTEESATVPPADGVQEEPSSGKEKWEFETQEKKEHPDASEKDAQPVRSSSMEKNTDKSAGKESPGEKKETPSASATDNQRRSSTGSNSGKPTAEKERRPGSGRSGGRNLWVCNLSKTTRAADLKAAFSKYGKVAGAKVVTNARSPGTLCYGFVMMSASSEAQRAMNHLHRTELHGRTIHVEWAGNDPVPGGRKPPLIPPSLLASEKEKEEAKEAAKTSSLETTKTDKATEKVKVKTEGDDEEGTDVKKPDSSPSVKLPVKAEEKKPVVKKEPSSKEGSQQRASSKENLDKDKEKEKEKKDILSLDKIKEQRDKERHRNREREMREIERRRERERAEQFRRQRELLRRRTREEEEKICREREQLKLQRMQLEQERLERERLERERIRLQQERQREQERLERERALSMQLRLEQEHRSALKRTLDARGMPLHEMDPYMGEQKRRLAMESGLIPPPVVMPPMEMQGGMMNNQRGPDIGGDRRFDRRDHRGIDRREDPGGRFGNVGRFRDDARVHREERGGPRRDDARKPPVRRDDNRREEARRSDTRREEGRREDQRKEVQRREPQRREEPSRREEAPHRGDPPRRSDNRRDENYQRRDVRESRGNSSTQRQEIHRREEPTKRDEPARREQHQGGRFGGEKDERRVIATNRTISNRTERFESRSSRGDGNQFTAEQGDSGLQSRRRTERDRAQPETARGRDAERPRGSFNAERGRYDSGGDGHFQRRASPSRSRPQQSRDSWKQDHHSNISGSDTRRVTASHDSWKQNQQSSQQSSDRRVELRTVDHHHERPAAREIIDHSSSFNRSRLSDFPEEIAQESPAWNAGSNSRSLGSFSERSMMRDGMQRHSSNSDIGPGLMASNSRSDDKWSSGRMDQTLNTQQDRWPGGVSLSGISSSLASGMTQSSQPLNTMLGNAGPSGFGTSFNTNALGNLINSISGSSASSGSNFGLDRRNMQSDNRFDSFPSVQGIRRF